MKTKKDVIDNLDNITLESLEDVLSTRFARYAKYIIQDRALPDVRDGLKPVQRRILFAMFDLGLFSDKAFKKSARVVGEVIGKYHPHGDTSIYDALIRMAQDWKINYPLIEVHGNKGSIDDDPAAAMRYTEARLSKISLLMLEGIKKNTVKFSPNFDDSEIEPIVLPSLIPNLLVNGAMGIAAGYATDIPPHNLGEIIDLLIALIQNGPLTTEQVLEYVKGPDFPTGGIIQGKEGIVNAFETGQGKIIIRAKINKIKLNSKSYLEIKEIPYGVIKSKLIDQINQQVENSKIKGIKLATDQTDLQNGLKIMVEIDDLDKADIYSDFLFSKTDLQISFNYNNVVIKDGKPSKMSLQDMAQAYLDHQIAVQKSIINFDLEKDNNKLEIVDGLIKATTHLKDIIKLIQTIEGSKQEVINKLMQKFEFTKNQAQAISELKLYRLSKTDQNQLENEKSMLEKRIQGFEKLLHSKKAFDKFLIDRLIQIKNEFNLPRKTQIIEKEIEKISVNLTQLVEHEDVYIFVSEKGYIKKISLKTYDSNDLNTYFINKGDKLVFFDRINTIKKILIFTSLGRFISIPLFKLEDNKWKELGKHLNEIDLISTNEKVVQVFSVQDFNNNYFLTLISKIGKIKRVDLKDFDVNRLNYFYKAINLTNNDQLVNVVLTYGNSEILIINNEGRYVNFIETLIPVYNLKSSGVKAMNLNKEEFIVGLVSHFGSQKIGLLNHQGGIKKILTSSLKPVNKNTMGKPLYFDLKGKNILLQDAQVLFDNSEIIFVNSNDELESFNVKKIKSSSLKSGFDNFTKGKNIVAKINSPIAIDKNNVSKETENLSHDELFLNAQKSLEEIEQISIDNILKKIKNKS